MKSRTQEIESKKCKCGVVFFRKKGCGSDKQWDKRRYCSHPCAVKYFYAERQNILWANPLYREKMSKMHSHPRVEYSFAMRERTKYTNLHHWVKRNLGSPKQCEQCKKIVESNYRIHWANKSREYKKEITDWIRLCVECHRAYDRKPLALKLKKK